MKKSLPARIPNDKALITGASSGIGAEFARQLAGRGYDLVLVARREEKLRQLVEEVARDYGVRCEVFPADLSRDDDTDKVVSKISETENLDMLVNNAGFGTAGHFAESDLSRQIEMINVHVMATVKLAKAALPNMIARGQGDIIDVSSTAGFLASAGNVNYNATKAYLITFSEALQAEVKDKGIRVQALCPGFTRTEFHEVGDYEGYDRSQIPQGLWMSAEQVVRYSLKCLEKNKVICIPGWKYRLFIALAKSPIIGKMLRPKIRRGRYQGSRR